MFERIPEDFARFAVTPSRYVVEDDVVVVEGVSDVTSQDGTDYEIPFVHVWRLHGDELEAFRQYTDTVLLQEAFAE
jgi:ketosteroid isomerase-like protein